MCDVLRMENSLKGLLINCWYCIMIVLWIVQCYEIFRFLIILWTCHLHYSETWFWQVLYKLRKNKKLKRMYHFEGRIECRNGYYILRNVSHAAMDTIYGGTYYARWLLLSRIVSNTTMDAWTYMSPMDPGRRDSRCVSPGQTCITILLLFKGVKWAGWVEIRDIKMGWDRYWVGSWSTQVHFGLKWVGFKWLKTGWVLTHLSWSN